MSLYVQFSSVQSLSSVQLCVTKWTAAPQASLSITSSQSPPKPMSIESVMPSNHLILCRPLSSLLQFSPASGSFQMSQFFESDGQSVGFSFNISPSNEYSGIISFRIDQFDLLAVQGLSTVFSNTTVQKHQFFGAQPSLWSNSQVILLMGVCRCSGWCPVLEPTVAMVMAINILFLNKH